MKLKVILFAVLMLASAQIVFAQQATEKSVRTFLLITGVANGSEKTFNNFILSLRRAIPDASEEFWTEVKKEINSEELVNLIVPIYQRLYTEEVIEAIIAFYQSPAGKQMMATGLTAIEETQKIGQTWADKVSERTFAKAKAMKTKPVK